VRLGVRENIWAPPEHVCSEAICVRGAIGWPVEMAKPAGQEGPIKEKKGHQVEAME
jgi:hypothetical protein